MVVELLEKTVSDLDLKNAEKAKTISIRGSGEYRVSEYIGDEPGGLRIYACDADCDNCHCATY